MTGKALSVEILQSLGVRRAHAALYAEPLRACAALFDISGPGRLAPFIGQALVESARLSRVSESLSYSDPERIARIFRTGFDLDRDRKVDPEEIEFARGFVRQPAKLANRAYAGRNGNGPEASGDGWRYRGRGLFQLTGRAWYERAGRELGRPYLEQPDLLLEPSDAALTAAWYWSINGCNRLADLRDLAGITRAVNGPAMLHHKERVEETQRAMALLA